MRPLLWIQDAYGNWQGKVGHITVMALCWHTGRKEWLVSPKLPGDFKKTTPVESVQEGLDQGAKVYREFLEFLDVPQDCSYVKEIEASRSGNENRGEAKLEVLYFRPVSKP